MTGGSRPIFYIIQIFSDTHRIIPIVAHCPLWNEKMPSFPTDLLSTADTEKKSFHIKKIRKDSQTGKDIERDYGSLNPFGQFPNEKNSLIFPHSLIFSG